MKIQENAAKAIEILENAGYETYAVGGCVRDSLMGIFPQDWDLCTAAPPEEVRRLFPDSLTVGKGFEHGTVVAFVGNTRLEITTFRSESGYSDFRRPDSVKFVSSIEEDLSRRDFTVNAMAYSEKHGLIDLFGGREDIKNKLVRCVGNAEERFREDALRILRALRFSSRLGFSLEKQTADGVRNCSYLLEKISSERIREELLKLLCGDNVCEVLTLYRDVIGTIIPEIRGEFDLDQHNPHHCYDVYTHTVRAVGNIRPDSRLRLTMLLHDIGKPSVFALDENGVGHFKKHPSVGAQMAEEILRRLKFDSKTVKAVKEQILEHDNRFAPDRLNVRRFMAKHGREFFFEHLEVRTADTLAQSDFRREEKLWELSEKKRIGEQLVKENAPLSLGSLAIDGEDVVSLGVSRGKAVGIALESCLAKVVDEELPNQREILMDHVKENFTNGAKL